MISSGVNTRELILEILLQIEEEGEHSHIAIRNALSKYQFLPKQERSFITRVCEGTLEYRIYIDYVIDSFSKVSVNKMKPQIREILRSAVYQLKFMDSVPDSAVCNEAVKLAQRKGFYNLKPFVNGVLRTIAREIGDLELPSREENEVRYLSVKYSMPEYLVEKWKAAYGVKTTEKILEDFLTERPITVRCRTHKASLREIVTSLKSQGVTVEQAPYLPYAENPDFPDEEFDVIVSRNLTWTLPDAEHAYQEWFRVLKPGGVMINLDANYGAADFADTADLPENHAHHQIQDELMQECEDIKRQLPISSFLRPAWDLETLSRIGVEEFSFDLGISKRIYTEKDEFYNPTPMFLIFAKKQR